MSSLPAPASLIFAHSTPHLIRPALELPPHFSGMFTSPTTASPSPTPPSHPLISPEVTISALSENNVKGGIRPPISPATPEPPSLPPSSSPPRPFATIMTTTNTNISATVREGNPAAGEVSLPDTAASAPAAGTSATPEKNSKMYRTRGTSSSIVTSGTSTTGSRKGAARAPRSRGPTEFICKHEDCRRVFRRKTSLTNHTKAHNNKNSRSILRMKRIRRQQQQMAEAAMAPRSSDPRSSVQNIAGTSVASAAPRNTHNDIAAPGPPHQWTTLTLAQHQTSMPTSDAQQQHQMQVYPTAPKNGLHRLDGAHPTRGSPANAAIAAVAAVMGGPMEPIKSLDGSHGVGHTSDYTHSSGLRHHHPDETVVVQHYTNSMVRDPHDVQMHMYAPILPSWPPSSGLGVHSLAISNEMLPYDVEPGTGMSEVPIVPVDSVGDSIAFGEMQQEHDAPLAVDTHYLSNLETLKTYVLPDHNVATVTTTDESPRAGQHQQQPQPHAE